MRTLAAGHPALKDKTTIFLKTVKAMPKRLLQPASTNRKLGAGEKFITKGKWKGKPMYQLTLEERATCPRSCQQWTNCYGNNMPFANRIDHESDDFYDRLGEEVAALNARHGTGFVVRLHVLGDFFSTRYVRWWLARKLEYPEMELFGYTHRDPSSAIGKAIQWLNKAGAWIRWSDRGGEMSANVAGEGIACPQETGKTASCLTCGLCWGTKRAISFQPH